MWAPTDGTCWSCEEPVGHGYRLDCFLVDGATETAGPYLAAPLCMHCFSTLAQAMGQQGKRALRESLTAEVERLRAALQQIVWRADANDPVSVSAATIARAALEG